MTADGPAGGLGGGGDSLMGEGGEDDPPPYPPYNETVPWFIRDYQDPVHGPIPIVEGRVIVSWRDYTPAILPEDPNYFDGGVEPSGTWYTSPPYPHTRLTQPDIAAFIATENLIAFSEWSPVASAGFLLPQGTTVEYAIANWPVQYPNLIAAVEPDEIGKMTACVPQFPNLDPGDDGYLSEWAINPYSSTYHIRASQAWRTASGLGVSSVQIAIIDSGVDWSLADLWDNGDPYGANVGDDIHSTEFKHRTLGGGEPWPWVKNRYGKTHAENLSHGVACAGICSARINNDCNPNLEDKDIAGVCQNNKFISIACKAWEDNISSSTLKSALMAMACMRRIYNPAVVYGPNIYCPVKNIEVASISLGYKAYAKKTDGDRMLKDVSPYITVVASAGNNNSNTFSTWPGNHPMVLCVAAYKLDGQRSLWGGGSGSNWHQPTVNIAAPGSAIYTLDMRGQNPYQQHYGWTDTETYNNFKGTSAATPFAAGVCALVTGAFPTRSPAEVRARIASTSSTLPGDLAFCGHLNALKALEQPW